MSKGLELLAVYVEVHKPIFEHGLVFSEQNNIYFCGGSMCDTCFVYDIRKGASCRISTEEYENLKVTNPEYMI
jgi:hypothetical protein